MDSNNSQSRQIFTIFNQPPKQQNQPKQQPPIIPENTIQTLFSDQNIINHLKDQDKELIQKITQLSPSDETQSFNEIDPKLSFVPKLHPNQDGVIVECISPDDIKILQNKITDNTKKINDWKKTLYQTTSGYLGYITKCAPLSHHMKKNHKKFTNLKNN